MWRWVGKMTLPIDHDDGRADSDFIAFFLDPDWWKRRPVFVVKLVIIVIFFRQAKQGSVEVERGAQLTIGFERGFAYVS